MCILCNSLVDHHGIEKWVEDLQSTKEKNVVFVGCESTGHCRATFGDSVQSKGIKLVFVNPYHVKQSMKTDDSIPPKIAPKGPQDRCQAGAGRAVSVPILSEQDIHRAVSSNE